MNKKALEAYRTSLKKSYNSMIQENVKRNYPVQQTRTSSIRNNAGSYFQDVDPIGGGGVGVGGVDQLGSAMGKQSGAVDFRKNQAYWRALNSTALGGKYTGLYSNLPTTQAGQQWLANRSAELDKQHEMGNKGRGAMLRSGAGRFILGGFEGLANGLSFGLTGNKGNNVIASWQSQGATDLTDEEAEQAMNSKLYKGGKAVGTMASYMVPYGTTGKAFEKLSGKLIAPRLGKVLAGEGTSLAGRAVGKISKPLINRVAKGSARKEALKLLGKGASKEVLRQEEQRIAGRLATETANRLATEAGKDLLQDLTIGNVQDYAIAKGEGEDYTVGDFLKNNAANLAIGGAMDFAPTAVRGLGGSKPLKAEKMAQRVAEGMGDSRTDFSRWNDARKWLDRYAKRERKIGSKATGILGDIENYRRLGMNAEDAYTAARNARLAGTDMQVSPSAQRRFGDYRGMVDDYGFDREIATRQSSGEIPTGSKDFKEYRNSLLRDAFGDGYKSYVADLANRRGVTVASLTRDIDGRLRYAFNNNIDPRNAVMSVAGDTNLTSINRTMPISTMDMLANPEFGEFLNSRGIDLNEIDRLVKSQSATGATTNSVIDNLYRQFMTENEQAMLLGRARNDLSDYNVRTTAAAQAAEEAAQNAEYDQIVNEYTGGTTVAETNGGLTPKRNIVRGKVLKRAEPPKPVVENNAVKEPKTQKAPKKKSASKPKTADIKKKTSTPVESAYTTTVEKNNIDTVKQNKAIEVEKETKPKTSSKAIKKAVSQDKPIRTLKPNSKAENKSYKWGQSWKAVGEQKLSKEDALIDALNHYTHGNAQEMLAEISKKNGKDIGVVEKEFVQWFDRGRRNRKIKTEQQSIRGFLKENELTLDRNGNIYELPPKDKSAPAKNKVKTAYEKAESTKPQKEVTVEKATPSPKTDNSTSKSGQSTITLKKAKHDIESFKKAKTTGKIKMIREEIEYQFGDKKSDILKLFGKEGDSNALATYRRLAKTIDTENSASLRNSLLSTLKEDAGADKVRETLGDKFFKNADTTRQTDATAKAPDAKKAEAAKPQNKTKPEADLSQYSNIKRGMYSAKDIRSASLKTTKDANGKSIKVNTAKTPAELRKMTIAETENLFGDKVSALMREAENEKFRTIGGNQKRSELREMVLSDLDKKIHDGAHSKASLSPRDSIIKYFDETLGEEKFRKAISPSESKMNVTTTNVGKWKAQDVLDARGSKFSRIMRETLEEVGNEDAERLFKAIDEKDFHGNDGGAYTHLYKNKVKTDARSGISPYDSVMDFFNRHLNEGNKPLSASELNKKVKLLDEKTTARGRQAGKNIQSQYDSWKGEAQRQNELRANAQKNKPKASETVSEPQSVKAEEPKATKNTKKAVSNSEVKAITDEVLTPNRIKTNGEVRRLTRQNAKQTAEDAQKRIDDVTSAFASDAERAEAKRTGGASELNNLLRGETLDGESNAAYVKSVLDDHKKNPNKSQQWAKEERVDSSRGGARQNTGKITKSRKTVFDGMGYSQEDVNEFIRATNKSKKFKRNGQTIADMMQSTEADIKRKGHEALYHDMIADINDGTKDLTTAHEVTMYRLAEDFKQAFERTGDIRYFKMSNDMVQGVSIIQSESGKRLQAIQSLQRSTPMGRVKLAQRELQRFEEARFIPGLKDSVPDELWANLMKANTPQEIQKATEDIAKVVWYHPDLKATWWEKVSAWRYLSMLSSPKTHLRNIIGNGVFMPIKGTRNLLATGLESLARKSGKLTQEGSTKAIVGFGKADRELRKYAKGQWNKIKSFAMSDPKYQTTLSFGGGTVTSRPDSVRVFKSKTLEGLRKFNGGMLEAEDRFFAGMAFQSAYAQRMKAMGVTPEMVAKDTKLARQIEKYAIDEALDSTYRQASDVADTLNNIRKGMKLPKSQRTLGKVAGGMIVDAVMPFTKTPINILKTSINYSPVGLIKGVIGLAKSGDNIKELEKNMKKILGVGLNETGIKFIKRNFDPDVAKRLIDAIGNGDNAIVDRTLAELPKSYRNQAKTVKAIADISAGITGTGIVALGYILGKSGIANGAFDDSETDRLRKDRGEQEYSINFTTPSGKKVSYTLDWAAPIATPLFLGVNFGQRSGQGGWKSLKKILSTSGTMFDPLFSMSVLSGLSNTLDTQYSTMNNPVMSVLANMGESYVSQFVPTPVRQAVKSARRTDITTSSTASDPVMRNVMGEVNYLRSGVPFGDKGLGAKVDLFGNTKTKTNGQIFTSFLANMISPGVYKEKDWDNVSKELYDFAKKTGDGTVIPKLLGGSDFEGYNVVIGDDTVHISEQELSQMRQDSGKKIHDDLETLFKSKEYKDATDDDKTKLIKEVYTDSKEYAKRQFLKRNGYTETDIVWEYDLSDKQKEKFTEAKNNGTTSMTKGQYTKAITKIKESKLRSQSGQTLVCFENGMSDPKDIALVIGSSKDTVGVKTYNSAVIAYRAGLTPKDIDTYLSSDIKKRIDLNESGSVNKAEAITYINSLDLPRAKKAALFAMLMPNVKTYNNPYL